jgi:hypothetical protein
MSTQINVTVDSGDLRQRDNQQRQALRLAKAEADNQAKVKARATDQRTVELRKQLLGSDGRPLYGTAAVPTTKKEEPAANAIGAFEWILPPTNTTQINPTAYKPITKRGGAAMMFAPSADPGAISIGAFGSGPPANDYSLYFTSVAPNNGTYGSDVNGLNATDPAIKLKRYADFTYETYAKIQTSNYGGENYNSAQTLLNLWITADDYYYANGDYGSSEGLQYAIYLQVNQDYSNVRDYTDFVVSFQAPGGQAIYTAVEWDSGPSGQSYLYTEGWTATPDFATAIGRNEWIHVALTRKNRVMYAFINGQLVAYGPDGASAAEELADKTSMTLDLVWNEFKPSVAIAETAKTRFIKKGLYTSNFIPS